MAFNWFKKKEESTKKASEPQVKVAQKETSVGENLATKKAHLAYGILLKPVITEKSTYLEGGSQYCFEVSPRTNKVEIKKAVEGMFGAHVEGVRIINSKGKQVRYGRMSGKRKNRKKAIVTIKKGERIEVHKQV